jgi:hypothetical protein
VAARVPLDGDPNVDTDGFVEVPNEARRAGEQAIEIVADHLSVLAGVRIEIWSPRLPAAFSATEPDALKRLQASKGLRDFDRFMPVDIYRVEFDRAHVKDLDDREEGVTLLAECLAAQRHSSQFRDLIRFFEAAFGTSSNRLVVCLSEFLEVWPALGYSKTEVKRWITSMRGPAVHADRGRSAPIDGEFRTVVRRMLFGAHDVLMNKKSWRSRSTDRRDRWRPTYGPLCEGGLVAVVGERAQIGMMMLDRFGAFRTSMEAINFTAKECWPDTGPAGLSSLEWQQLLAVPASEFYPGGAA